MAVVTALQGDTLDLLLWRIYGRTAGLFEAVLSANPGLASQGVVLPLGTRIVVPDAALQSRARADIVQLWT